MNNIDKDEHDDGSVYLLKGEEDDLEKILDYKIDVAELSKKYKFSLQDRETILQGSLQLQSGEPDIELLKKAIDLINQYKSAHLKKEQSHLRHAQQKDEKEVAFASDLDENVWKPVLVSLFFGPIGLLTVSWQLAVGVGMLAAGMFFILPELLASVPVVSAALAWLAINKRMSSSSYRKNHKTEEIVFKTGEEESLYSHYMTFLKKEKTVWLAAVLGFVFGFLGLLYVSWIFALGMFVFCIASYISFPILLIASPFISLGLALYAATETNAKLTYRHLNP
jgi:hypothetical protein